MGCRLSGDYPFCDYPWREKRYRTGIENPDAYLVYIIAGYRGSLLYAVWSRERHLFLAETRLLESQFRSVPRCLRTVVLFAEHRYGLYLYLCFVFLTTNQPHRQRRSDWRYRYVGGHSRRTHDIPCSILRRRESRQWSFADLHHPAQCV